MNMELMVRETATSVARFSGVLVASTVLFILTTNTNVWLSTTGIQGGLTSALYLLILVLRFVRFGGRRNMQKKGYKMLFPSVEMVKAGKNDAKTESTTSSVESGNKVAPA